MLTPPKSKSIVVDLDVLIAAGQRIGLNLRGKTCRESIEAILDICHHVSVCSAWSEEWERHKNSYCSTWLRRMNGPKKIENRGNIDNQVLRDRIRRCFTQPDILRIILEDFHLCETALLADKIVVSCDDTVRGHLSRLSNEIEEIRDVVWVNPTNLDEDVITWLQNGAKHEKSRTLGQYKRD